MGLFKWNQASRMEYFDHGILVRQKKGTHRMYSVFFGNASKGPYIAAVLSLNGPASSRPGISLGNNTSVLEFGPSGEFRLHPRTVHSSGALAVQ